MTALPTNAECQQFATAILQWFDQYGRKHLPWQHNPSAYRVWISEIMLQQTQVTTVIPYFEKFMQRFPDVQALAAATQDEVLDHWSGLGYYARGRNLHKAAQRVVDQHSGQMPTHIDELMSLPGIGRSTAGAILSLSQGQHHAILDGNVKRVLSRYYTVDGWYGQSAVEKRLWQLSEALTPAHRTGEFNQAMMDMGATLCTRGRPQCTHCPLQSGCGALVSGNPVQWPHKKPKKERPLRSTWMVIVEDASQRVWMERRPPSGIWGGLWGFSEFDTEDAATAAIDKMNPAAVEAWSSMRHVFTHFELIIYPVHVRLKRKRLNAGPARTMINDSENRWVAPGESAGGVAAPVERLLSRLRLPLLQQD
ncbi:MAG: A/G-specific adenine glycosylase [Pseudomonadota bacterium]